MDDEPYFSDELLFRMPFLRKIDGSFQLDLLPIITHHYKIDSFQEGFDVMRSGASGKVILDWE